jgi:3-deoxy-D-manno-octulosonic-acid transferase
VLIDRLGVLADAYAVGDVAFVGGGFHAAGLHSVLEPAALAKPVLVGPAGRLQADAMRLIAAGGARAVDTPDEMAQVLLEWLGSQNGQGGAGAAAAAVVQSGLGAAERSAALVRELVGRENRPGRNDQ